MTTYVAKIRLPNNGGDHSVTVQARNTGDAKKLVLAQYSGARILSLVPQR